jgi:hypothetical protein
LVTGSTEKESGYCKRGGKGTLEYWPSLPRELSHQVYKSYIPEAAVKSSAAEQPLPQHTRYGPLPSQSVRNLPAQLGKTPIIAIHFAFDLCVVHGLWTVKPGKKTPRRQFLLSHKIIYFNCKYTPRIGANVKIFLFKA